MFICVIDLLLRRILQILYWISLLALTQASPDDAIGRNAYGVYFHPIGKLEVVTDYWLHSFDLALPRMRDLKRNVLDLPSTCTTTNGTSNSNCSATTPILRAVNDLQRRAEQSIITILSHIRATFRRPAPRKTQRHGKRGFIDFIGDVCHSLFGLSRDSDLTASQDRIKTIIDRQQRILGQFESDLTNLASATSITNTRLDVIRSHIATQDTALHDLSRALTLDFQMSVQLAFRLSEILYNYTQLESHLQGLLLSLETLTAGRLEAHLIHKADIQRVLEQISKRLHVTKTPVRLLTTDATSFYRSNDHLAIRRGTLIVVTLKIPVTTFFHNLALYKVTVTPKVITDANPHSTLITDLPKYFAVSSDHTSYAFWSDLPAFEIRNSVRFISKVDILIRTNPHTCIMALFLNDAAAVQDLCPTVLLSQKLSSFVYLTPTALAVENSISNFTLHCRNKPPHVIAACSSCVISIPPQCQLANSDFLFPASYPSTKLIDNQTTVVHTYNLAILQNFFSSNDWNKLKSDTTLAQQLTIRLPTFVTSFNASAPESSKDAILTQDLSRAMNAVKEGHILFKSNADILQDQIAGLSQNSQLTFNIPNNYLFSFGSVLLCFLTLATIYLLVRVHKLSAIIVTLSRTADATIIPNVWIFSTPPTSTTLQQLPNTVHSLDDFSFQFLVLSLLFLIIFIWLITRLCKLYSKFFRPSAIALALSVTNAHGKILVPWFTLRYAVHDYEFLASNDISQVHVSRGFFKSSLHFKWDVTVLYKPSQHSILLHPTISLSPCLARRLRRFIAPHKRYTITLILLGVDFQRPLSLDRSCSVEDAPVSRALGPAV